jgi:glycosyltransferase involved in cell wall biosynthesis
MVLRAETRPHISVVIAARNEQEHIEECIRSIMEGTLGPEEVEVIVADGGSTDGTREIVSNLAARHTNVRLIDNPRRITPVGFNLGIRASRGETICVMGGHAWLDADYLRICRDKLSEVGADIDGGPMETICKNTGASARLAMAVQSSRFGVGSSFRNFSREGPIDTTAYAVYRRSVFERFGLFDERLVRNQDNELASRVRQGGGQIWMVASVHSHYYSRPTVGKMLKQNFRNGLYNWLTWRINPASFTLRHAVPFAFVLFLLLGIPLAVFSPVLRWVFLCVLGLYLSLDVLASIEAGLRLRTALAAILPLIFPALHVAYGTGTLLGVFRFGLFPGGQGPEKLSPRDGKGGVR